MLSFVATSAVLFVAIVPVLGEDAYYGYPNDKVVAYPSNTQQYRPVDPYPSYKQPSPAYPPVSRSYIGKRPYSAPVYDGTHRLEPQTGAARQLGLNGPGVSMIDVMSCLQSLSSLMMSVETI